MGIFSKPPDYNLCRGDDMFGEIAMEQIENKVIDKEKDKLAGELIEDIIKIKTELDAAVQNYNFTNCHEILDHYTYKIKAAQTKYNMLLKQAKEKGIANAAYLAGMSDK